MNRIYTSEFCSPIVNKVREQIAGRSVQREDLIPLFRENGLKTLNLMFALASTCFEVSKEGKRYIYRIPRKPIHIEKVRAGLKKYDEVINREVRQEDLISVEEAIEIVKRHGYKVFYEL